MANNGKQAASILRMARQDEWNSGDEDGSANEYMQEMVRRSEEHHLLMKQMMMQVSEIVMANRKAGPAIPALLVLQSGGARSSAHR